MITLFPLVIAVSFAWLNAAQAAQIDIPEPSKLNRYSFDLGNIVESANKRIVYIGESSQLRNRRNQHKNGNNNSFVRLYNLNYDDLYYQVLHIEEDDTKRKALEVSMISAINPRYNRILR